MYFVYFHNFKFVKVRYASLGASTGVTATKLFKSLQNIRYYSITYVLLLKFRATTVSFFFLIDDQTYCNGLFQSHIVSFAALLYILKKKNFYSNQNYLSISQLQLDNNK